MLPSTWNAAPPARCMPIYRPPLARAHLNGFPLREVYPVPVTRAGVDRFIISFRAGVWTYADGAAIRVRASSLFRRWRDAEVQKVGLAFNAPLASLLTDTHSGNYPAEMSFLTVEPDDFLLTSVFPEKTNPGAMSGLPEGPQTGLRTRGFNTANESAAHFLYESRLRRHVVGCRAAWGLVARDADSGHLPPEASGIATVWLQPNSTFRPGKPLYLDVPAPAGVPTYTRYWRQNFGAAPAGIRRFLFCWKAISIRTQAQYGPWSRTI